MTKASAIAGKTALVTGAARRIGRDIATALAESGVNVAIHYRHSAEDAASLQSQLIQHGVTAWLVQGDFEGDGPGEIIHNVISQAGSLDILVNSAASFVSASVQEISFPGLINDIQVNAWSPFVLCREFARQSGRGSIVNLLDTRVLGFDRAHAGYILSKKLLLSMTEILALELAPHITVNAVAPGLILPPAGKDEAYLEHLAQEIPLKRPGGPVDVSEAVLFLLRSGFITGQVIYVDGGRHLKGGAH